MSAYVTRIPAITYIEKLTCSCGGEFLHTGGVSTHNPPLYQHKCNSCDAMGTVEKVYPCVTHEPVESLAPAERKQPPICFKHPVARSVRARRSESSWSWHCHECGVWLDSATKPSDIVDCYRICKHCALPTRVTTAWCDHCDVEDK